MMTDLHRLNHGWYSIQINRVQYLPAEESQGEIPLDYGFICGVAGLRCAGLIVSVVR